MSGFIGQVQLPDWTKINSLFSPDQVQMLHNQALASNTLPDQAQANLLISQNQGASGSQDLVDRGTLRDNALGLAQRNPLSLATAASLPGIGGTGSVNSLSNMDAQTAASKLNLLQYSAGLPQMPYSSGAPGSGSAPSGSFMDQMTKSESGGNPAAVNSGGYSGSFQFGTGRMTDLHMYQPAQGENPNGNTWQGTITIPGFAPMTHAQFLANPDAQRMAGEVHFKDIGQQIDNTPGAQDYDRAGLAAVAQLGGIQGMQQFVATGGKYNPHDSNGTSLQNYYDKFSQTGFPGLKQSFGHPDGPLPADHPARGVQMASAANTAGMPPTANDAVPVSSADGNPALGSTVSDTPAQLQTKLAQFRANVASGAPPADPANQVAVDPAYAANMQAPTPGMGMPAPQAVAQARQELDPSLQGAPPDVYNAAIQNRALQIINQTRQQQGSPALTTPSTPTGPSPDGSPPPAGTPPPPPNAAPAVNAPRPIIPGSKIITTAPFADQRFPPAPQDAPAVAPNAATPPVQTPVVAAQPPSAPATTQPQPFNPMAGLPPGSKPITTMMGGPYTAGAPAGYAMAQTPPSAQFPRGQMVPYPLLPPVLKEVKTPQAIINVDPRTGQEVSRIAIPETGRMTSVETPDGHQNYINGHPVGDVIPFSGRPQQNEAYQADQKTVAGITANAQAAQSIMPRLNEMAQIQPGLATGLGGETRSKIQAVLEQMGADPADAAKLTGISSAADADLYRKLATSTAGTAAKADLGANNGVEAMRIYQSANPGMSLQPDANKRITNMLRVQQQSVQDYADAVHQDFDPKEQQFLSGGKYVQPLSAFNRQWQAQANPQVYAAATGILNGDPYTKWADKLGNGGDALRAVGIAARIDPKIMVPIAGDVKPATALLSAASSGR